MKKEYIPQKIESIVQKYWKKNNTFKSVKNEEKEKFYCLSMLPYPSGNLHIGHVRNYTISDVIARYQRMLGKNVLHPIGWDAFGLPAEEAAIKNNIIPELWIKKNIKNMKKQLQLIGFSYDWSREINTSTVEFYRWEQWFFLKLYKKNLVYKKKSLVHWCNFHETVLANEQVQDGLCWRCNQTVTVKKIYQWFLKISDYSNRLLSDLKKLSEWPKKVLDMQKNWIGKEKGKEIKLSIFNSDKTLLIFITKLSKLLDITYIAVSPFHNLTNGFLIFSMKDNLLINKYKSMHFNERSKSLIGINTKKYIIHPITEQKIPLWIGMYVDKDYRTGVVAGYPKNNKKDFQFCLKNKIPTISSLSQINKKNFFLHQLKNLGKSSCVNLLKKIYKFDHSKLETEIFNILSKKNIIKNKTFFKLKDWSISRQRYWGTPIPIVTTKEGKILPVLEKELPIVLPVVKDLKNIHNSMKYNKKWFNVIINDKKATRETDTFDTFIESSWYHVRYTSPNFKYGMVDKQESNYWLPVDQYIGGIEHATMHLIYLRFYHKLLYDFGLVSSSEPVKKLLCQGMVLGDAFYFLDNKKQKHWISPSLIHCVKDKKGKIIQASIASNNQPVIHAGMIKMSKSKNNGIEPSQLVLKYGADSVRLFIMFAAPATMALEWNENNLIGTHRFIKRIWNLYYNFIQNKEDLEIPNPLLFNNKQKVLYSNLHQTIKKVSDDIEIRQTFNTAISSIMSLVNCVSKFKILEKQDKAVYRECLLTILKLLYPFIPHVCFYIWKIITKKNSLDKEHWPIFKKKFIISNTNIVIQINGKKKYLIQVKKNLTKNKILEHINTCITIKNYLKSIKIKNIIHIPNKVLNFVIETIK
ncbi:Leucine--tRNA ligase [Buchnera aphidicola (Anoecia corni)]|uniref:Leucine--tRNA ligase n=1 Tax=Buchnera aphidicola (Anoecia corni) TaxID=2994477 RepID=A0AAT9IGW5_9GAMM